MCSECNKHSSILNGISQVMESENQKKKMEQMREYVVLAQFNNEFIHNIHRRKLSARS